jgi:lysophospholipase L1-like esterase
VLNRGVSGDRVRDLRTRWERDVLDESPAAVSIMIGINDVWRRYDNDDPTSVDDFTEDYLFLLASLRVADISAILCEPILMPATAAQEGWQEDLGPKIAIIHDLAREFDAILVPTHTALNARRSAGSTSLAPDGVHPSDAGHTAIAEVWLAHVLNDIEGPR